MTRLMQCDRCQGTAPLDDAHGAGWATVSANSAEAADNPFDFGPWLDACPNCQTGAERETVRARQRAEERLDALEERAEERLDALEENAQQRAWRLDVDGRYSGHPRRPGVA